MYLGMQKIRYHSYTSLYNCETSHGKYMYGNHLTDGHHGCKITIKINKIVYSRNFRLAEFCQYVLFGKYFKRYVGMSPLEYRNNG